jgi:PIN domain nuclease of toxin-antitoxin system
LLPRLLLDTHIAIRWVTESKKLSREQARVLDGVARRQQNVALCALSLLETAILASQGKLKMKFSLTQFFGELQANPVFSVLPLTYEIASEAALFTNLRDPADQAIVATARVHRLKLVTSDQRIIKSKLVAVIA